MRVLLKVSIPVEAGNKGVAEGTLPATIMSFVESVSPEATYFLADKGQRTALFVFDMKDSNEIPSLVEPFMMNHNALVELQPAMNLADLRTGIENAMAKG